MRVPLILLPVFCSGALQLHAQHIGLDFYRHLEELPYIYPNVEAHYLSSYDRGGGNDDGFNGTYSELYTDENGEHVIFEEDGPGCVYNLWFTGCRGGWSKLDWGRLRFYFDREETPRLEMDANHFFSGHTPPFDYPLVTHCYISSGGYSCSVPFPFSQHLKITTERKVGFYNIYYILSSNVQVKSWTGEEDYGRLVELFERCGADPKKVVPVEVARKHVRLPAWERSQERPVAELFCVERGGVIQFIKINPLYAPDGYDLNHVLLRITWDDQPEPAVSAPIGPFFGSGLGEADVRGLFIGMTTSGTYYCYFPMPFQRSALVQLVNESYESGGEFFCEIGYRPDTPPQAAGAELGYLGAQYRVAWPITDSEDYVLFEYHGRGAIVGQVMTVEPVKPDVKRWWEGDMRVWIDGEETPRFHGTGHEDEYQGGWSSEWLKNPYSLPLFGEPKTAGLRNVRGQINGSTTVYRFWPGTIPFRKSIVISTEHGNQNDTPANYSSVVYYYFVP